MEHPPYYVKGLNMKKMKGIILAGGSGSRLYPLTVAVNKHLLPVGDKPMVVRCLEKLTEAGITEIAIVTNPEYVSNFSALLKSGSDYGCDITYKVQDKAGGIAEALELCENFVGGDNCTVLLGDNMFEESLVEHVKTFNKDCKLFFKHVPDGHRYGVACFEEGIGLYEILEKPTDVTSAFAAVGIYIYSSEVFDLIKKVKPSDRGEREITSVNNMFLHSKYEYTYDFLDGWWTDAGTMETYMRANELIRAGQYERSKEISS
jgi:glucose-1-phosphate thymidylyltransferase